MIVQDVISREVKGVWGSPPQEGATLTPVIKTNNMSYEGHISFDDLTYRDIPVKKLHASFLHKGDLLIEKSGGTKTHSVGYVNIFENENDTYVCNNFIFAIRPNVNIIFPKYLFFQLKYMYETGQFSDCYNKTTGIQNLKTDRYLAKSIKCPTKSEQQKITFILNSIEQAIQVKEEQLKALDELIQSRFTEMFDCIHTNKFGWNVKKIEEISTCIAGATPSTLKKEYWEGGTIPWLSSGEVHKGRIFETDKKITELGYNNCSTKLIPAHTVVLALAGQGKTRGTVAVAEIRLCTNQSICSIVNDDSVNVDYLYYYLKSQYDALRDVSNGAGGRGGLNLKIVGNFKILLPPLPLQNQFAEFVKKAEKAKEIVKIQIKDLQELLSLKMDEYFK